MQINGRPVIEGDFSRKLFQLDAFPDLTYFETVTAAALALFAEARIDVAVLEAGMGGSWDATRLAASQVAGLTNVGTDHRDWLGSSRAEIAGDKGCALDAAERAVIGNGVSKGLIDAVSAPRAVLAGSLVRCEDKGDGRIKLGWNREDITVPLPLSGSFQKDNAQLAVALALQAVDLGWISNLDHGVVGEALRKVRWPGRLSRHRIGCREVLVDCAHNLEAAHALADHLATLDRRYNLLFSCLDDKPVEEMAALLRPQVNEVAVCPLVDKRAMPIDRLAQAFPGSTRVGSALEGLEALPDPIVAAGSLRLAGEVLVHSEEVEW